MCVEPSQPPGDAPCPRCGTLLWFLPTSAGMRLYETAAVAPLRNRIAGVICNNLGVDPRQLPGSGSFSEEVGADSLDLVELVMELEENFEVTIPAEEAEKMKTINDVIDYLIRHGM
jgi:acyl carrier protein